MKKLVLAFMMGAVAMAANAQVNTKCRPPAIRRT